MKIIEVVFIFISSLVILSCNNENKNKLTYLIKIPKEYKNPEMVNNIRYFDDPKLSYICDTTYLDNDISLDKVVCKDTVLRKKIIYDYDINGILSSVKSYTNGLLEGRWIEIIEDRLIMDYYEYGLKYYERYLNENGVFHIKILPQILIEPKDYSTNERIFFEICIPYTTKDDYENIKIDYEIRFKKNGSNKNSFNVILRESLILYAGITNDIYFTPLKSGVYEFKGISTPLNKKDIVDIDDSYLEFEFIVN
jgi:hypothetical protein